MEKKYIFHLNLPKLRIKYRDLLNLFKNCNGYAKKLVI
jgi:hypothetical protein